MPIVIWSVVLVLAVGLTWWAGVRRRRRIVAMATSAASGQHVAGPDVPTEASSYGVHAATITGQGPTFGPMN